MKGTVVSIKDLIVRVRYDDDSPKVDEVLIVDNGYETKLLVDHLEPGGIAMALNIRTDRRVQKGMEILATGQGIMVHTGEDTIGRILDALGDPLDGQLPITGEAWHVQRYHAIT